MDDLWTSLYEKIDAEDYDTAIDLLDQADGPGAELIDVVNIDLVRCRIGASSEAHRSLIGPALARIADRVDVGNDPSLAPVWHFYRVTGDLLGGGAAVGEHVRECAEAIVTLGIESQAVDILASLLRNLHAYDLDALAAPLHRWAQRLEPVGHADWDTWHELAFGLRATGAGAEAERICAVIMDEAPPGRTRTGAAVTLSVHLATEHRHDEARALLGEAFETATREGWTDLADIAHSNLMATHAESGRTEHLESGLRAWLADIDAGRCRAPAVDLALKLSVALRSTGSDLLALELLARYADRDWSAESDTDQLAWLEATVDSFRGLSDDFTAAELCQRAVAIDERLSRSTVSRFRQQDYDRIARAYDLLVTFHADLERFGATPSARALFYLEAAKEAAFSRALPGISSGRLPGDTRSEVRSLVSELAQIEAVLEDRLRWQLIDRHGDSATRMSSRIRIRPPYATEQEHERRSEAITRRLRELRRTPGPHALRVDSFLAASPQDLSAAPWPDGAAGLAQRLDRGDNELVTYLVGPGGFAHRNITDINPAVLDSLLTVLAQFPGDEVDYIASRLADLLLPAQTRSALVESGAHTLIISGDPSLQTVPWEAIGSNTKDSDRLGLRFSLCRTPSLLRGASQLAAPGELTVDRALIVADPTGDLPSAMAEGAMLHQMLTARGVETTWLPACTRDAFVAELPHHSLVHFAGHTNYLRTDPASSHMVFSDGPFTVDELARTSLRPNVIFVLSSCESVQSGQELSTGNSFGLGAVLLLKGAAAVIGSNWPADDATSLTQNQRLYARLLDGETVPRALRSVRQELYDEGHSTSSWALLAAMGHPFARVRVEE